MARDPGSTWAPISEAGRPDGHTKDKFIVHSTGTRASAAANRRYFERGDVVVESTFIVGLTDDDPTLQVMDSTDHADANGDANRSGISVEVVGLAGDPFTPWQEAEIVRLGRWARANHPIPARIIPTPTQGGLGWHVMFGAPGPWTSVRGKECPGPARIARLRAHLFPVIAAAHSPAAGVQPPATPTAPPARQESDVTVLNLAPGQHLAMPRPRGGKVLVDVAFDDSGLGWGRDLPADQRAAASQVRAAIHSPKGWRLIFDNKNPGDRHIFWLAAGGKPASWELGPDDDVCVIRNLHPAYHLGITITHQA